jgi:hypothetical protein
MSEECDEATVSINDLYCPITSEIMCDPVVAEDPELSEYIKQLLDNE